MSTITMQDAAEIKPVDRSRTNIIGELWNDKSAFFSLCFLVVLILAALFAPWLAPYDPAAQSMSNRMLPPVWAGGEWSHVLGTDNLGRDLLSRLIYGARASLGVGFSVVAIAGSVGVGIGMLAGYAGGIFDRVAMRVVDAQLAIPDVLLALIVLAVVGPSFWAIVVVLSIGGWMIYGRTVRNIVVSARKEAYVVAAEMVGARQSRILIRHILPNLVAPLLTLGTLEVASVILAEAALSFLGVGIQPPMTSWGLDISKGRDFLFTNPWLVMLPGIAITLTILSINLLATFLRRTTDPVEREKRFGLAYRRRNRSPAAKRGRPSRPVSAGEQTLLEIDDLTVAFETRLGRLHVVRGVSLSVKRGETPSLPYFVEDRSNRAIRVPPPSSRQPGGVGVTGVTIVVENILDRLPAIERVYGRTEAVEPRFEGASAARLVRFASSWLEVVEPMSGSNPLNDHLIQRGEGVFETSLGLAAPSAAARLLTICGARIAINDQ